VSIEVSGGGSVAVETEAMLRTKRDLVELSLKAGEVHEEVERAIRSVYGVGCAGPATVALLTGAGADLADAARDARLLAGELEEAAETYGLVEQVLSAEHQLLARLVGPPLAAFDVALVAAVAPAVRGADDTEASGLVFALRALADSLNIPALLTAARLLPGRAFEETPVTATEVAASSAEHTAAAPGGFADLAARIPAARPAEPQVRVEKYTLPNGDVHWVVYSAGTIDWAIEPSDEPWDDTSNVVGVTGGAAGSTRAAVMALKKAGWKPGELVLPVGHSQGGIVATAMVASGAVTAPMLVTFGSPTAGVKVPKQTVDVALEHTDDPVPALGGSARPFDHSRLLVREPSPTVADASALPAHSMSGYQQTAVELDASTDPRVVAARATLADFTGGQSAEVTLWRGERLPVSGGPAASRGGR